VEVELVDSVLVEVVEVVVLVVAASKKSISLVNNKYFKQTECSL